MEVIKQVQVNINTIGVIGASLSEPHLVVSTAVIGASLSEPHLVVSTAALSVCLNRTSVIPYKST